MKILIIGSKGFIGSHCTEYFSCKEGYETFGCDIIADYNSTNYYVIDATHPDFSAVFLHQKFDCAINCSGAAQVADSFRNPRRDYELNTANVYRALDAIRLYNPECRFLNLSSAAIYGTVESLPVREHHPLNPISPYGMHKKYAEQICNEFHRFYQVKTCNARIFSAYGPGLQKQLFWELHKKCNETATIEVYGTGNETRDFIYITDLVRAIELFIGHARFEGEQVNIGNGKEISIFEAVQTFVQHYKPEVSFRFTQEVKEGDPLNWVADISTIKSWGYVPQISLNDGLKQYTQWLNEKK